MMVSIFNGMVQKIGHYASKMCHYVLVPSWLKLRQMPTDFETFFTVMLGSKKICNKVFRKDLTTHLTCFLCGTFFTDSFAHHPVDIYW